MDLESFRRILTPDGQKALAEAVSLHPKESEFLQQFSALSRRYPRELARTALELAILRAEAQSKFPNAEQMYFTRPALEQATSWQVSNYRMQRFQGYNYVVDLGCSIGGDTLALAEQSKVIGVDNDPLRLAMAHENLAALSLADRAGFIQADLRKPLPLHKSRNMALFFDPARRKDGRRAFSVRNYAPPLEIINRWLPDRPSLGVKISPGVKLVELETYDAEIEFISVAGELKEAVLWFGPLKSAQRRATILPGGHTLYQPTEVGLEQSEPLPISEPLIVLYEPDPAILRAGLVQDLGWKLGAAQLDADIAYLTANQLTETPFARSWLVEDWMHFSLKRLRAKLHERGVGIVTVKKRGSPLQPEELIRQLRLNKDAQGERVLFLTHLRGSPIVVTCFP